MAKMAKPIPKPIPKPKPKPIPKSKPKPIPKSKPTLSCESVICARAQARGRDQRGEIVMEKLRKNWGGNLSRTVV